MRVKSDAVRAYFDHAATSPILPEVLAAYTEELQRVGNPSSLHASGQSARMRMEQAREDLAAAVGASTPSEIVFTSGGTEADNLAVKGLWHSRNADGTRPRILVSTIEHHAVLESVEWLESLGAEISWIPVDGTGLVDLDHVARDLAEHGGRTALVSVMLANNEIGTLEPLAEIVALAHAHGVPVHTDAVQAFGHVPLSFAELGVDALTVSAHKIGGPVGTGALVLARALKPVPVIHGGGQERSLRSGTLDVAGAVAFAEAARLAVSALPEEGARLAGLRDRLIAGVERNVPDAILSGPRPASVGGDASAGGPDLGTRLPGNVHFVFPGAEGDSLLFGLDMAGFDTSTGSACQAGVSRPSHVLLACGADEDTARSTQRFTLGPRTTETDIDELVAALPAVVDRARTAGMVSATPAWMKGTP